MPPSNPSTPPSLATIAKAAGVSAMTVSLALRNHHSIPVTTRERVQKVAEECGYRPDPVIGKLMQQLRMRGRRRASISMCVLCQPPTKKELTYGDYIIRGAKKMAATLGYSLDQIELDDSNGQPRRLRRLLRNRGIEGVLLVPIFPPADLSDLLDWSEYSVVSTSVSVLGPKAHRVLPDQFGNAMELCRRLGERGFRRLGHVTNLDQDTRVGHRISAAVQWHNHTHGIDNLPSYIGLNTPPPASELNEWLKRCQPDAIISDSDGYLEMFRSVLPEKHNYTLASTSTLRANSQFPGMHENPELVGAAAIELLSALFQHGDRGIPQDPRTTLIAGTYWEPKTVTKPASRRKSS
jgi:DNA-binding LacI/PurR family transcriptional regulator